FSSRRRHTRSDRDWSSDVCSSDLSSGQRARSGSQGSSAGSTPEASATASPARRRGDGKSMFAQTPSRRPGLAPSEVESRWVSQRSEERRVGKEGRAGGWPYAENEK